MNGVKVLNHIKNKLFHYRRYYYAHIISQIYMNDGFVSRSINISLPSRQLSAAFYCARERIDRRDKV